MSKRLELPSRTSVGFGPAMAGAWDVVLTAGRGGERQFQSRNRVTLK